MAILLVSALASWRIVHDMTKKNLMGREGYLEYQGHYFDKYIARYSHSLAHEFGYIIFFALGLAIYELIAIAFERMLRPQTTTPE